MRVGRYAEADAVIQEGLGFYKSGKIVYGRETLDSLAAQVASKR